MVKLAGKRAITICGLWISCMQVSHIPESITLFRRYPATIKTDPSPEFTCRALNQLAFEHGVELRLIEPTDLLRFLTAAFATNA